jgi:GDP-L-fucose synthase
MTMFPLSGKRVFVAGHRGMVGQALVRALSSHEVDIRTVSRQEVDLTRQEPTEEWFANVEPDVVIVAAARVGGILANTTFPQDFLYDNLIISANVINAAFKAKVQKLLFLGSSCIYPKMAPQPIQESALLTGPLEPTNEWYAIAKIAGIKLAQAYRRQSGADYISLMPSNLYGPGDNYHPEHSHVMGGLIRRFHEAVQSGTSKVTVWGTGMPRREFLFVDDLAQACIFALQQYSGEDHLNVGTGSDLTIAELAGEVAKVVGFKGEIEYDHSKPDGTPRKLMDVSRLQDLGWRAATSLQDGLKISYGDFLERESRNVSLGG